MRLIDADKFLAVRCADCGERVLDTKYYKACDHCYLKDTLEQQPTVEPKKGEWFREDGSDYVTCSECGDFLLETEPYNFCPNCGADMRGDSNG